MTDTPFRRADRLDGIELSEIVQISEAARALEADGRDIVKLSTGEPDFPTPPHVIAALHQAGLDGKTRYTATAGTPELRGIVAGQAGVAAANVVIGTGAKQILADFFLCLLNEGDEVITPTPFWTSYRDIVGFSGGRGVEVVCSLEDGFKLSPAALAAAITDRTRAVLINTPSNPSGAVYSAEEMTALAEVLRAHPQVWIVSDEIYEHLNFVPVTSFRDAAPDLADRTLIVNGVSKAYSMTGFRIGWGIGPVALIKAMTTVQGQITSGACSLSQAAAAAALTGDQALVDDRRRAFRTRRDRVVAGLNAVAGITCPVPDGAFYVFPSIAGLLGKRTPDGVVLETDADYCRYVLESAGVALVPGRAFGAPGHFRLSFAYADDEIDAGLARIASATAALID